MEGCLRTVGSSARAAGNDCPATAACNACAHKCPCLLSSVYGGQRRGYNAACAAANKPNSNTIAHANANASASAGGLRLFERRDAVCVHRYGMHEPRTRAATQAGTTTANTTIIIATVTNSTPSRSNHHQAARTAPPTAAAPGTGAGLLLLVVCLMGRCVRLWVLRHEPLRIAVPIDHAEGTAGMGMAVRLPLPLAPAVCAGLQRRRQSIRGQG